MLTLRDLLWSVGAPIVLAAVAILSSAIGRWRTRQVAAWGPAVAIAGSFVVAYCGIAGTPNFPPTAAQAWLVYLSAVAVIIAVAATFFRGNSITFLASGIVLCA